MTTHVALLRAINVGGRGVVSMSDLRGAFESAGGRDVRTYIQSGNVMFEAQAGRAASIVKRAGQKLRGTLGGEPVTMLRTAREIEALVTSAPFNALAGEPGVKLYVAFLSRKPKRTPPFPLISDKEALEAIRIKSREVLIVSRRKKNGFFGFPNNFIEEQLGVSATTRNWATVTKIALTCLRP